MTERGRPGDPDPAEPSNSGDSHAPAARPQTFGLPADLSAVRRTDAIIESLAARRAAGSVAGSVARPTAGPDGGRARTSDDPDPAVRLLRALITDVDDQGPGCDAGPESNPPCPPGPPAPPAPSGPGSGGRRRGSRTIVALGVAGAVLASTGVAAAGGGVAGRSSASPAPSTAAVPDDADEPAGADTDPVSHDRLLPPVRPAPVPDPPATRKPSGDPDDDDPGRARPPRRHVFPHQPPLRRPDVPAVVNRPAAGRDDRSGDGDLRRHLDGLRKRAERRAGQHRNPYAD